MLHCTFENGSTSSLRHIVTHCLVEKDGKILLVKRAQFLSEGGKWTVPGGFLDRGETIVEGALRELLEESGWKGEVVSLFRINSNPNRPKEDRQNVPFEFIIRPIEEVSQPDHEVTGLQWFSIDQLPPDEEIAFDLAVTLKLFAKYCKTPFPLPILE